jgi:predicted MFS family arabinose efflux permease
MAAGLGFYMFHNTLQTNATQMAPQARGIAVSLFAACFFLGQTVGVAVASLAAERFGTRVVLIAGGAGVLAIALWFAALRARQTERAAG